MKLFGDFFWTRRMPMGQRSNQEGAQAAHNPWAHPVGLTPLHVASGFPLKLPGLIFVQKNHQKVSWYLDFVWYSIPENPKTRRKHQPALGTRLIG